MSDDRGRRRWSCGCCRRAAVGRAAGRGRAASPSRPSSPRGNAIAGPLLSAHEGVTAMEIGIYGLGRMGGNMATRLLRGGHRVVAGNRSARPVDEEKADGAGAAYTIEEMTKALKPPRILWAMVPAGAP